MMKKTFAFLGAGNMGGALIEAVCRGEGAENVLIYDRDAAKAAALSEKTGCRVATDAEAAVREAYFLFLCVKPDGVAPVLRALGAALREDENKILVSIAAGVTRTAIKDILSEESVSLPVVRLLPNTPVAVGKGLTLASPDAEVSEEDFAVLVRALTNGGEVARIDERYIDPATPVFSSSPAFVYMFIEALADGGVMAGLPREQAQRFAAQAVLGAAAMVLETGAHPGALKDAVCSPGGSTIVGVEALERGAFRAAVASAVYEAYLKTTQLGK